MTGCTHISSGIDTVEIFDIVDKEHADSVVTTVIFRFVALCKYGRLSSCNFSKVISFQVFFLFV